MLCFSVQNAFAKHDFYSANGRVALCRICWICPRRILGSWSDHDRSIFLLAEAMKGFFDQFLNLHFLRKSCKIRTFSYLGLLLLLLF